MLKFKDQKLHFPAELSAQLATGSPHAQGLLCEQQPPLHTALLSTTESHSGQADSMATWPNQHRTKPSPAPAAQLLPTCD